VYDEDRGGSVPAYLLHSSGPLVGLAQSQALSPGRLIFLISLVVFFTVLFVVAYVWMRKPGFGQHGGHEQPKASRRPAAPAGRSTIDADRGGDDVVSARTVPTSDSMVGPSAS
jgi:hypothetical protein